MQGTAQRADERVQVQIGMIAFLSELSLEIPPQRVSSWLRMFLQ